MEGGGSPPFTPFNGGDFENTKIASYFHNLGQLINITMFIKPKIIINQRSLLFVIIAEVIVCGQFEQIGANCLVQAIITVKSYNFISLKQNYTEIWRLDRKIQRLKLPPGGRLHKGGDGVQNPETPPKIRRLDMFTCMQTSRKRIKSVSKLRKISSVFSL